MLNVKQFNGKQGCANCEYEGVPCVSAKMIRDWPYQEDCMYERTHKSLIECAIRAVEGKSVISIFLLFVCFAYTNVYL